MAYRGMGKLIWHKGIMISQSPSHNRVELFFSIALPSSAHFNKWKSALYDDIKWYHYHFTYIIIHLLW